MDTLDVITGILVVAVVIAAILFPINRNGHNDDTEE